MFEFDQDTAIDGAGGGTWTGRISGRWALGAIPNGGYLMALTARAMADALPHPHPLSLTAYFVKPSAVGPAEVEVEVVKKGRRFSVSAARLLQDGGEVLRMLATFGDLSASTGPTRVTAVPPDLPDPESLPDGGDPGDREVTRRFDFRFTPESIGFAEGRPSGRALVEGWLRFGDGREPDPLSLPVFCDAFPPAIWNITRPAWVPTLEMTVHVRALPAPGWLASRVQTRALMDGRLEEDCEIWDSQGTLVAMSRQLALIGSRPKGGERPCPTPSG